MPLLQSLATINSLVRTVLATLVVGAGGWGLWYGYQTYHAEDEGSRQLRDELAARTAEIGELEATLEQKQRQIERLDTAMRLLKVDHRLAEVTVIEQQRDSQSGELQTTIEFVEVNDEGYPIDEPREFTLLGDMIYVDYWVVKFEDKYVEQADIDRSTSICLFRRIFGEHQEPYDGYVIDEVGSRPTAYARGGQMSEFEQQIWDDFWNIAHDPDRAQQLGIRAAHGEAVSTKLRLGKTYRLHLRASGGLTITPAETAAPST